MAEAALRIAFSLAMAPLMTGVVNRVKALWAGRKGRPLLQPYFDLWRLFHKGAVYSTATTWVFRAGPVGGLAALLVAACLLPIGGDRAALSFAGDFVVIAYLLGLARLLTALSALDTGSSFEGMGASRELQFSLLAELAFVTGLFTIAWATGKQDASSMFAALAGGAWNGQVGVCGLVAAAMGLVVLVENSRVPFDDPETHLELTMIHEVMVLDHSGPDLGLILYAQALKLWLMGSVLAPLVIPFNPEGTGAGLAWLAIQMLGVSVAIGTIESMMARFRLLNVPKALVGAGALSFLALLLSMR